MTGISLVCFLTIEYRERETWAAELAGPEEIWVLERDFGGHVLTRDYTSLLGVLALIEDGC
ncbi:hypothetical protein, partial [Sinorhizobium medicae]|uniref:hypothetical protein n=1 Tax=Sinorhizobium medicae TaxID=110321 RepID=UPI001AEC652C